MVLQGVEKQTLTITGKDDIKTTVNGSIYGGRSFKSDQDSGDYFGDLVEKNGVTIDNA